MRTIDERTSEVLSDAATDAPSKRALRPAKSFPHFEAALKDGNIALLEATRRRKDLPKVKVVPALGEALLNGQLDVADWILGPFDLGKFVGLAVVEYMLQSRSDWWTANDTSFAEYKTLLAEGKFKGLPVLPKDVWSPALLEWMDNHFACARSTAEISDDDLYSIHESIFSAMQARPLNLRASAWLFRFYDKQPFDFIEDPLSIYPTMPPTAVPALIFGLEKVGFLSKDDVSSAFEEDVMDYSDDEDMRKAYATAKERLEELILENPSVEELEREIEDLFENGR